MDGMVCEGTLFVDYYQLTMVQLYYKVGLHYKNAQFDYFFRNYPNYGEHKAGYCINAGLQSFCSWLQQYRFTSTNIEDLHAQYGSLKQPLFSSDFLSWLSRENFIESLTLYSIPEGRAVHPNEPIITVNANLAVAQLLESSLLNHCNFQTLIATKASRIREAGEYKPLIEFGMRRAHGAGADEATRAALIGGADFTSNTEMSIKMGLSPKGTHAHSMVQLFIALGEGELGAFRAYADIYPDDCLLLVDTINTLESGVPNAIKVFEELKKKGHEPVGIRLDSGDLAYLAIKAAQLLNKAGFENVKIVLSNNIDELVLMQVLKQIRDEAPGHGMDAQKIIDRLTYGVGTRLVTSHGQSSLDGVYKLTAVKHHDAWIPALKISDTLEKTMLPGLKKSWRIYDNELKATADLITTEEESPDAGQDILLRHPLKTELYRTIKSDTISSVELLFKPVYENGICTYSFPSLSEIRSIRENDLACLDLGVKRIINPHIYHVSMSEKLWQSKKKLTKLYI